MRAGERRRRRAGLTLIEALVGLALMSAALVLVLDALVGAAGTSAGRVQRSAEVSLAARAAELISWDLDRAVVTQDGPRVALEGRGLVIPVRETATGAPTQIWYRFDPRSGLFERGHPTRGYEKIGALPFERVRWQLDPMPAGAVAVSVQLIPRQASRDGSLPATPVSTRAIELVAARVVEPAVYGEAPVGWQEPTHREEE